MKEMDLMYAMTDLEDDLLVPVTLQKVAYPRVSQVLASVAVAAMLTLTVFASVIGIEYWFGTNQGEGTLNVSYPLEQLTIRQEAYDALSEDLLRRWVYEDMPKWLSFDEEEYESYSQVPYMQSGASSMTQICDLEELEEFLGVDLAVSPEVAQLIEMDSQYNFGEEMPGGVLLCGPTYEEALREYEATGKIALHGIRINLSMNKGTGCVTYLQIIIPLTQDYEKYHPTTMVYSFEEEGETYDYNNGSRDFVIAKKDFTGEYGSKYGSRCVALYTDDGIGYYLNCIVYPSDRGRNIGDIEAERVILPLVDTLK